MAKIEELIENEEFISKIDACEDETAVKNVFAEYGVEISENADIEISAEQLEDVTGGVVATASLAAFAAAAAVAWKVGTSAGILITAYSDCKKYGDPYRTYSKEKVDSLLKILNVK